MVPGCVCVCVCVCVRRGDGGLHRMRFSGTDIGHWSSQSFRYCAVLYSTSVYRVRNEHPFFVCWFTSNTLMLRLKLVHDFVLLVTTTA